MGRNIALPDPAPDRRWRNTQQRRGLGHGQIFLIHSAHRSSPSSSVRCHNAHTCSQRTRSLHRRQKNEAKMDNAFSQALADWTAFYALMGGAAATLLGLLF